MSTNICNESFLDRNLNKSTKDALNSTEVEPFTQFVYYNKMQFSKL